LICAAIGGVLVLFLFALRRELSIARLDALLFHRYWSDSL
jgi:hypothetical protein